MELSRYWTVLLRWWWLILVSTGVAGGASYFSSYQQPEVYQATTTLMVGQFLSSTNPQAGDFTISQQLAQYYAQQVRRQTILQAAADSLGPGYSWGSLAGQVNAVAPAGSHQIHISAIDPDPMRAKKIADELARQLILSSPTPSEQEEDAQRQFVNSQLAALQRQIEKAQGEMDELDAQLIQENSALQIQDLQRQISALETKITTWQGLHEDYLGWLQGSRTNYLSITEPAFLPTSPVNSTPFNSLLAAAMGFILAVGAAFLLEYLDDRLRTPESVKQMLGLPTLGVIPNVGKLKSLNGNLFSLRDESPQAWESCRLISTKLQLALRDSGTLAFLVTSPEPSEIRSSVAAKLALSFALAGRQTILVDADINHPSVHSIFEVPNEFGLATLLKGASRQPLGQEEEQEEEQREGVKPKMGLRQGNFRRRIKGIMVPTEIPGLSVITSGPSLDNARDLLGSMSMDKLLKTMKAMFDVVILLCPPVLTNSDTTVLAAKGVGVVLVLEVGSTRRKAVRLAKQILGQVNILGVVLNHAPKKNTIVSRYSRKYGREKSSYLPEEDTACTQSKVLATGSSAAISSE
ncbi:MAG: hypothetical protein ACOX87_04495 [Chloroflexota bacterium]|jgi:succinoglycan biosynthesis transport protein ExoP